MIATITAMIIYPYELNPIGMLIDIALYGALIVMMCGLSYILHEEEQVSLAAFAMGYVAFISMISVMVARLVMGLFAFAGIPMGPVIGLLVFCIASIISMLILFAIEEKMR